MVKGKRGVGNVSDATVQIPETTKALPEMLRDEVVELTAGDEVGRYVIEGKLGSGGMGIVYRAFDPSLSRNVALKLLHPAARGAEQTSRLLREAQALAQLNHENVVAAYDVGTFGDAVFVALELIEGQSMRSWLESNKDQSEILRVLVAAGRGLIAAHKQGVVHRDFKPANVMVSSDGKVRVLDFGLARTVLEQPLQKKSDGVTDSKPSPKPVPVSDLKEVGSDVEYDSGFTPSSRGSLLDTDMTVMGAVMGTPGYMAPEQWLGEPIGVQADIFAYSATCFKALCGTRPFVGANEAGYRKSVLQGTRKPWPKNVPRKIRAIVDLGLQRRASDRYEHLEIMVDALEASNQKLGRTVIALSAVAVVAVVAMVTLAVSSSSSASACVLEDAPFRDIWGQSQQSQLQSAFTAVSPGFSGFDKISSRMEQYQLDWKSAKQRACEATYVRGEQTEELYGLRSQCLDRLRNRVQILANVFLKPDKGVVEQSIAAVHSLESPEICGNTTLLLKGESQLPEDPVVRSRIQNLQGALDTVQSRVLFEQLEEALELAERVEEASLELNYKPILIGAMIAKGGILARLEKEGAVEYLEKALSMASEEHLNELTADAGLAMLTRFLGVGKHIEATAVLPFVESSFKGAQVSTENRAMLLALAGSLQADGKNYEQAIVSLNKSVELFAGLEHPRESYAHKALVNRVYVPQQSYELAALSAEKGLETARKYYGNAGRKTLHALMTVANANIHNSEVALAALREAKEITKGISGPNIGLQIPAMEAEILRLSGDCQTALKFFEEGISGVERLYGKDTSLVADSYLQYGICLEKLGRLEEGEAKILIAVLRLRDGSSSVTLADSLFALAKLRWKHDPRRAAKNLDEAMAIWNEATPPDADKIAIAKEWISNQNKSTP